MLWKLRLQNPTKGRYILSFYFRFSLIIFVASMNVDRLSGQMEDLLKQFTKTFFDNYKDPRLKMAGNIYIPASVKPELTTESAKKIIYTELDK